MLCLDKNNNLHQNLLLLLEQSKVRVSHPRSIQKALSSLSHLCIHQEIPIIIVPTAHTNALSIMNAKSFFESEMYVHSYLLRLVTRSLLNHDTGKKDLKMTRFHLPPLKS